MTNVNKNKATDKVDVTIRNIKILLHSQLMIKCLHGSLRTVAVAIPDRQQVLTKGKTIRLIIFRNAKYVRPIPNTSNGKTCLNTLTNTYIHYTVSIRFCFSKPTWKYIEIYCQYTKYCICIEHESINSHVRIFFCFNSTRRYVIVVQQHPSKCNTKDCNYHYNKFKKKHPYCWRVEFFAVICINRHPNKYDYMNRQR
ncbi:hypothetical protein AGLY_010140 [Aphis glycines]|uniref:Uncharacterized protein n=1 Tax=Aphis glycines TaxID=307491 RepID=A0A6G0TG15_APHGL|nr:hypothetical protein AGLY_010140 [Aphis glycines]